MMVRSKKLLRAANGAPCMRCSRLHPSVSARHANWYEYGKGTGLKAHDCFVAYLCDACNAVIDRASYVWMAEDRKEMWIMAHARTVLYWFQQGIVK